VTAEEDVASQIFLQWLITEQVEEEKNASLIVHMLQKIGPSLAAFTSLIIAWVSVVAKANDKKKKRKKAI
jgi:ferritin